MTCESSGEIFSDETSKNTMLKSFYNYCIIYGTLFLLHFINFSYAKDYKLFEPKTWYLTPGLWQLEGTSFWSAFLFETPFALLFRSGWLTCFFLICAMYYLIRALTLVKHQKKKPQPNH